MAHLLLSQLNKHDKNQTFFPQGQTILHNVCWVVNTDYQAVSRF